MSWVRLICVGVVFIILAREVSNTWSDNMTIDTFESTDNRLILMRASRNIKNKMVLLKRRLRKLIQRKKLHFTKLKSAKNKTAVNRLKNKLRLVRRGIKKIRQRLIKSMKSKPTKLVKTSNIQEVQAAFSILPNHQLKELRETCKKQECSQLCTPEFDNQVTSSKSSCHCHRGFHLDTNDNKTCLDINECKLPASKCEYKCINTMGSYYCSCPFGKKLSFDKSSCMDINECFLNNNHGPCQDGCANTEGSYSCTCNRFSGTRLNKDGHSCEDIDECKEQNSRCSHQCFNIYNGFVCGCPNGMFLDDDYRTCLDINECFAIEIKTACSGKCINTIGSYFCLDLKEISVDQSCDQMLPNTNGYYLCDRNGSVKVTLKGITDREYFLNTPGTICTYHTSSHVPTKSHVCNDRARWEDYPLTFIKNSTLTI